MVIANLEPRKYYSKNEVDCLPTCIRALLDTFGLNNWYYKITKNLTVTEYGYDFIEMATKLAENKILAEVGLYDNDYIPKLKTGVQLNYDNLTAIQKEKRKIPKHAFESLAEVRQFAKKYPDLIKIKKSTFAYLNSCLNQNHPICINVELGALSKTDDRTIHSIIVYGYDHQNKEIYIWDPNISYRIVEKKLLLSAWKTAGYYYLIVKNSFGE